MEPDERNLPVTSLFLINMEGSERVVGNMSVILDMLLLVGSIEQLGWLFHAKWNCTEITTSIYDEAYDVGIPLISE